MCGGGSRGRRPDGLRRHGELRRLPAPPAPGVGPDVSDLSIPLSLSDAMYLLICFRKSTPPQNRQLTVTITDWKYQVDGFVGEMTL